LVLDFGLAKDGRTAAPAERARSAARWALPCPSTWPVTSAYPLRAARSDTSGFDWLDLIEYYAFRVTNTD
jgi:hypothetical protein